MQKDEVIDLIHQGIVDITFEKVDGSIREMSVTLSQDLLPPVPEPDPDAKPKAPRKPNPEVQNVYVPNVGWRSFKWAALKTVNGVEYVNDN